MSRIFRRGLVPALAWSAALAVPLGAVTLPGDSPLQGKVFRHARLYVPSLDRALDDLEPELSAALERDLDALGASSTGALFDWRGGRLSTLLPSQPLIPGDGVGNDLRWSEVGAGRPGDEEARLAIRDALSAYVEKHREELRVDPSELGEPSIGIFEEGGMVQVHVPRAVGGIPVRDGGLTAVISHGNLVLLGLQTWGDVRVDTAPAVAPENARARVAEHLRPFAVTRYRQPERLEIVALARGEDLASVVAGAGYDYRLAWVLEPDVEADMGRWEALVDAASGELIAFQDTNQYAVRRVIGGVYPVSNDQRPPDGVEQTGWPMPYANVTSGSPTVFTTTGGVVPACISGSIATSLNGTFVRISDTCGAVNETSAGDIDLLQSGGTDCTVPAGHSAGDTHSARSGFNELNRIKEQARGYLPANAWLQAQLTANMNINLTCNAFWNGTTVNFYRDSGSQCRNTGEIAAIFDHEWGHGMDDNGVNGNISSPGEAIADIYAILRLDQSCVGRGFLKNSVCGGYGDQCDGTTATGCTGVRDSDWLLHRCNRPHGISWILGGFTSAQCNGTGAAPACPGGAQLGPCNRETHCEGQIAAEVGWDLQFRDLRAAPFNYDPNTALELATRLMYLGPQTLTSWYTCGAGCAAAGTCGCAATGGYLLTLAADDDNGNVNDGTPHMSAIRAAFERHEIHCATQAVTNSGCAGGPTAAPVLTAVATAGGVNLSWTSVPGASAYAVYRTEGVFGCNFGKVKIGQTNGTSFSDTGLLGGRQYFYGVLPVGANSSCFGLMSACASATALANTDPCGNAVTLSFAAAASTVPEVPANAPAVVTLATQNGLPTTATASASFATANGTATAGSDYTASSGTVSFPSGTPNGATQTLNVPILGDALDEPNETFTLTLSNPVGAGLGAITTHTVTITDDDAAPSVSIGDVTVTEGNAGTTTAAFTVTLSAPSGQAVTLNFATANGTASAGSDYVAASGTVSFAPGATTQTLNVTVNGDTLDEPDETFLVNLTNPTNATIADGQGVGTITDDDAPAALSVSDVAVTEGNAGTVTATFTVTLSPVSGQTVTLSYATADGTAGAGSDYVAASGSLTFAPGTTSQAVSVSVNGDTLDEPNETFFVNLTNPTNATIADGQGVGTITDDDAPAALSVNDVAVTEGNAGTVTATFTVTLSPVSGQIVTLSFATADGTAGAGSDYVAASGSLTFAPGTTTQAVSVSVNGDTLDEPNETFFVNLTNPTNATIADGQGVGTITDDDAPAALSIDDVTVAEGNSGTSIATFTLTLTPVSGQSVSVDFATADGSATAGSDYVATSGSLSFPPGTTARTVDVTVNGDATTEPDETFLVNVSNPTGATIADGQGVGTISNDDSVPSLSIADASVAEGDAGTVTAAFSVTLSAVQSQPVTVDFATADGTATAGSDYVAQSGSLSFAPGATTGTIDVTVNGDLLDEPDEAFLVDLTNPTNATVADGQGVGSIGDDDAAPVLSIADAGGREGPNGATTPVTFTLSLSAPSGQAVSVSYGTSDGTASAGTDYVAASGSLSFSPGATTGTLSVTVNGDDLREADETFLVDLTGPVNAGIGDGQALGTIANDDGWPELSHGQAILTSLQAQPGPVPDADSYRLRQKPGSSYEAVLDAASGDLGPTGPTLQRIGSDGVTVVEDSVPASGGSSRSLRWETAGSATVDDETLRVTAPMCGTGCGPEDVYRVRLYDTTASISRFNNSATQLTVMVLQNVGPDPVTGTIRFWSSSGALLATQSFTTVPHGTLVLNTAGVPGVSGQSGSITVASDVAYGALAGKAVAVEPATGFTFDTPLTFRSR